MKEAISAELEARASELEPKYRSAGEAQIGRLLDRYGLPFFYQQPTLIYDRGRYEIWHPDFTLPSANGMVIEYAGMAHTRDAAGDMRRQQEVYRENGIRALIADSSDLIGERWAERLYARIEEAARYALANPWGYGQRGAEGYRG